MSPETDVQFDERLHVPLRWWVQSTMFLASVWLAFIVALPPAVAWGATAVLLLAVGALFVGYGNARVRVASGVLYAGHAHIDVRFLADPTPLDAETTHRVAGRDADARAYHLLRPYVKRALKVTVVDPADPVPYWLVSTRRPDELAAAVSAAMDGAQKG